MIHQTAFLTFLVLSSASAFVSAPFGGIHKCHVLSTRQVLLSDPTESAETTVEGDQPQPAVAATETPPPSVEASSEEGEEGAKAMRERHTLFVGNLPFSKSR